MYKIMKHVFLESSLQITDMICTHLLSLLTTSDTFVTIGQSSYVRSSDLISFTSAASDSLRSFDSFKFNSTMDAEAASGDEDQHVEYPTLTIPPNCVDICCKFCKRSRWTTRNNVVPARVAIASNQLTLRWRRERGFQCSPCFNYQAKQSTPDKYRVNAVPGFRLILELYFISVTFVWTWKLYSIINHQLLSVTFSFACSNMLWNMFREEFNEQKSNTHTTNTTSQSQPTNLLYLLTVLYWFEK